MRTTGARMTTIQTASHMVSSEGDLLLLTLVGTEIENMFLMSIYRISSEALILGVSAVTS